MNRDTDALIERLAGGAAPVRAIATPLRRTLGWLLFACVVAAVFIAINGLRPDLAEASASPLWALEFAASLATGIAAAYAAFQVSVPGRSPRWAWLPLPFLLAWLACLGWGCVADAARLGVAAWSMDPAARACAVAIVWISTPMLAGMLLMIRHAGVSRPLPSAMLAMLAAASVSSAAVALEHPGESALMTLLWHLGVVLLLSLACMAAGRPLFAWIGPAARRRGGG